ncbi:MAG TPA: hypothetical protein VFI61_00440 [Patescibacteria group bacterium]|nr:hypothetical protein [Patescibacteria group bacterium]
MSKVLKFVFALLSTIVMGFALNTGLQYVNSQWTHASLEQARQNMGDQVALRAAMNMWSIVWWLTLVLGLCLILGLWYALYKGNIKQLFTSMMVLVVAFVLFGCSSSNFVIITPPNYAIVVNLSNTEDQATGNNFGEGELMNVTQIQINSVKCALNSSDRCPDKLVAEVQGSPESRIYSMDANSGTSGANQALCFEAIGTNGCVDFSVTAIIEKSDAKCYANKMGVKPVLNGDPQVASRYHFIATPLADALDTRVIQIASSQFAEKVAAISPLSLALQKFALFEEIEPSIIQEVHDQTCITISNMAINNGIAWASPEIQDQINQATILANQLELVAQQNKLLEIQNQAFIARALEIEKEFGLAAAIEFMKIQKWDGTFLPLLPGQPLLNDTSSDAPTP